MARAAGHQRAALFCTRGARRLQQQWLVNIRRHRALAAEQAAWLDMQRSGGDIAPDFAGRGNFELLDGGDLALDGPRDVNVLCFERCDHTTGFADNQVAQNFDISLDTAIDPDIAVRFERADDAGIGADHCFGLAVESRWSRYLRLFRVSEHWFSSPAPAEGICRIQC